jgi:signal peptidase II
MDKKKYIYFLFFFILLLIDQYTKWLFVQGLTFNIGCISFYLVYNTGIAFSMFEFLGEYLKYIQMFILIFLAIYIWKNEALKIYFKLPIVFIFAGGIGNIIDRFHMIGVVDFIAWKCYFDFAIFNMADIFINMGIFFAIIIILRNKNLLNKI